MQYVVWIDFRAPRHIAADAASIAVQMQIAFRMTHQFLFVQNGAVFVDGVVMHVKGEERSFHRQGIKI